MTAREARVRKQERRRYPYRLALFLTLAGPLNGFPNLV